MSGLERHIALDSRLRAEMRRDGRVTHALGYGSFPQGKADRFSDLEYWLFPGLLRVELHAVSNMQVAG